MSEYQPERPWEPPPEHGPHAVAPWWRKPGVLIGLGALVIVVGFMVLSSMGGAGEYTEGHGGAELACQDKVRAQVGQDAQFSGMASFESDDGTWSVKGSADGAAFTCTLTYSDDSYDGDATLY